MAGLSRYRPDSTREAVRNHESTEALITISSHRREVQPRYRRNLRSRYEASTLAPRAKQALRRRPVRWYPTHGYQQHRPTQVQAPPLQVARVTFMKRQRTDRGRTRTRDPAVTCPLTAEVISTPA